MSEYLPAVGKYRVIILDECHQLTKDSQNILLKELEKANSATVWILCTTDKSKVLKGVVDRCFPVPLSGMGPKERRELIERARLSINRTEACADFEDAITKAGITSPREILKAFESYANGIAASDAVAAMSLQGLPEYKDIAFAVVYKPWAEASAIIKALDEKLKKKAKELEVDKSAIPGDATIETEDLEGRPEVARGMRALVAAFLKGVVYKGGPQGQRAAEALHILAHCVSPNDFDAGLEFAATVGGLMRVNGKMKGQ